MYLSAREKVVGIYLVDRTMRGGSKSKLSCDLLATGAAGSAGKLELHDSESASHDSTVTGYLAFIHHYSLKFDLGRKLLHNDLNAISAFASPSSSVLSRTHLK